MNLHLTQPGFGPIRNLPRAVARRWPALAIGAVAVALPTTVALAATAATFPQGIFAGGPNLRGNVLDVAGIVGQSADDGVAGFGTNAGVRGIGDQSGVFGLSNTASGTGVVAQGGGLGVDANGGTGIRAVGTNGSGVEATASNGIGVFGTGKGQFGIGVDGAGDDVGVQGNGVNLGVRAHAVNGAGLSADSVGGLGGEFRGKVAPIRLDPATTPGAPSTATHHKGELYVDSNGQLFLCVSDGTPGTWKHVKLDP